MRREPIVLSERYLRAVKQLEALPENQSGADKTWVETLMRQRSKRFPRARITVWAGHWAAGLLRRDSCKPTLKRPI